MTAQRSLPGADQLLAHRDWRTDWTADRACLYWYLTFEDQPSLRALFADVEDDLRRVESIDVVPASWRHLTLLEVGYADEVTEAETAALVAAARATADLLPLTLDLGPITTMTDAVVLEVVQSPPLAAVQAILAEGLLACRGQRREAGPTDPFWPHVSLGYVNRDCARAEVMMALGDEVDRRGTVTVPRLTLATVSRMQDHYQWAAVAAS